MNELLIKLGALGATNNWAVKPEIDTGYSASWILGDLPITSITKIEQTIMTNYFDYPVMVNLTDGTHYALPATGVIDNLKTLTARYFTDTNGDVYIYKISIF